MATFEVVGGSMIIQFFLRAVVMVTPIGYHDNHLLLFTGGTMICRTAPERLM